MHEVVYLLYEMGECVCGGLCRELLHTEEGGGGVREGVYGSSRCSHTEN